MRYSSFIASPVRLEVLGPVHTWLSGELGYSAADPYAVSLDIDDTASGGLHEVVRWLFSRTLLEEGFQRLTGLDGDVQVWADGTDQLNMCLAPPGHRLNMRVSRSSVRDFLRRTYTIVPAGEEYRHVDTDGLIQHLLSEGEPDFRA